MIKSIIIAAMLLFSTSVSAYTQDEVIAYCGKWSDFVQDMAEFRDEGNDIEMFFVQMRAYKDAQLVSEQEYKKYISIANQIYSEPFKQYTPDELAFSYKLQCMEKLLKREVI